MFVAIDDDGKPRPCRSRCVHRMKVVLALALSLAGAARADGAAGASAHWIQQVVRVVAKDGKYTHVEIEWRFDPFSSEIEIPLIDEDKDGKFSAAARSRRSKTR